MTNIIDLPHRNRGNGAREALQAQLRPKGWSDAAVDFLLMELWAHGFKIVPVDDLTETTTDTHKKGTEG